MKYRGYRRKRNAVAVDESTDIPFLAILFFSIETIPMAHALSAHRSAVSKSIATSFIAMAWLKIHFFTQHTRRPPAAALVLAAPSIAASPRKDPRR
jgi:hypothetical protein